MASNPGLLGYWSGNQFQLPQFGSPQPSPLQMLGLFNPDGSLVKSPIDDNGLLQTSALTMPGYTGSGGGKGGTAGNGMPDLNRGPADIGYARGEATADTTTTATDSWRDFAKSGLAGLAGPFSAASYAISGKTPMGHVASALADLLGLGGPPSNSFQGGLLAGQSSPFGPDDPGGTGTPQGASNSFGGGQLAGQSGQYGPDDPSGNGGGGSAK